MSAPTDAERKAAVEWLERIKRINSEDWHRPARTILAMLSEPRLPAEPTQEMLDVMWRAHWKSPGIRSPDYQHFGYSYRALYAHLAKPVEKWGVSVGKGWVHFDTLDEAVAAAKAELAGGGGEVQIQRRDGLNDPA